MTEPVVSILIPCFNAERYLGDTLTSVFAQTWRNLEVVVVDDGSTDGSADVIRRFGSSRLLSLSQENRGQTAALNAGLARAQGDFIQYLDADDLISPEKIELQIRRLLHHRTAVASAEWGRFFAETSETKFAPEAVWQDLAPIDWLATSRSDGLGMMFPALWLLPRAIVDAIGLWQEDLTLNNDAEYFTRALLGADRVLFCPGARCYYRSGIAGSLSGRKSPNAWRSQFRVIELCQAHVLAKEDTERVRRGFALSWQHLAHACYPYDRTLAEAALGRARSLHPARIQPDGGIAFRAVSKALGWRIARRLQVASGRP
jgi:glycosyltransferase involved in cell wall biosynthesis